MFKRRSTKVDGTPECIPYRPHDMLSAGFSLGGLDYAEVEALGATQDDLDPQEFDRFRRLISTTHGDQSLREANDLDICRALRLLTADQKPTLGAVLLFGRSSTMARFVPTAERLLQDITTTSIALNESARFPLFAAAENLYEKLELRNTEEELMVGLLRVAIPRLPVSTLREAIANALVHRDYATLGPIVVQLDEDRLMVRSPGGFPPGVNLSNLLDASRPRSVVLTDAFKRAGLVDRAGRGINEMYSSLLRLGLSGPDYSHSTDASVTVFIPTSGSDMDMMRFVTSYENKQGIGLALMDLRILHEIKAEGSASPAELAKALGLSREHLRLPTTRLIEQGLLESRGNGRSRRFHLTAAFYRLAEDKSAYVRVRQADPIQQDQMVMSFVAAYGRITRGQVADLCHLSPTQARTVLQRLLAAGQIQLHGSRRGAYYALPDGHHDT